jgi:hypothetical protein
LIKEMETIVVADNGKKECNMEDVVEMIVQYGGKCSKNIWCDGFMVAEMAMKSVGQLKKEMEQMQQSRLEE